MDDTVEINGETSEIDASCKGLYGPTIEQVLKNQYRCTNDNHELLWTEGPSQNLNPDK
jgi:hypothetical protein